MGVWRGDAYCLLGVIGVMGGDVVSMAVYAKNRESRRGVWFCVTRHGAAVSGDVVAGLPRNARATNEVLQPVFRVCAGVLSTHVQLTRYKILLCSERQHIHVKEAGHSQSRKFIAAAATAAQRAECE